MQGTIPYVQGYVCARNNTLKCALYNALLSGDYIDIGSELSSGSFILVSDTGLEQEEGGRMVRELGSNSFLSFLFASSS